MTVKSTMDVTLQYDGEGTPTREQYHRGNDTQAPPKRHKPRGNGRYCEMCGRRRDAANHLKRRA